MTNVKKLIEQEKDKKRRSELYSSAITIASRYVSKDFLWNFFKEELEMIQDSPIVQEWIDQGIEKGIEKGSVITAQEMLFELLEENFGIIKQKIVDEIKKIESPAVLRFLFRQSIKVKSIDEFYEVLERVKDKSES